MWRAIWAQSADGVIGDGLDMLWRMPADMRFFSAATRGVMSGMGSCNVVAMGRSTWESFSPRYRPLPQRVNYVLSSRAPGAWSQGATVVGSLAEVPADAWILGGGSVYRQALPFVDEVLVTTFDVRVRHLLGDEAVTVPSLEGFRRVPIKPAEGEFIRDPDGYMTIEGPGLPARGEVGYRFDRFINPQPLPLDTLPK